MSMLRPVALALVLSCAANGGDDTAAGADTTAAGSGTTTQPGAVTSDGGGPTGAVDTGAVGSDASDDTASSPQPLECGAFTPGDDFNVCTATYLGGPGADVPGGVDVAPDGVVVVGGAFPGHDFAAAQVVLGEGDGAVVRLAPDGGSVLSVTRLAAAVVDVAVGGDGRIAVADGLGVRLLAADGSAASWGAGVADARRVAIGGDGTVAVLHGKSIAVFAGDGAPLGDFAVAGTEVRDLAVDGASHSVFATGYRQSDEGACQQYKSTFIRSYAYDGAAKWTDYDWNGGDVDDTEDCASGDQFSKQYSRRGELQPFTRKRVHQRSSAHICRSGESSGTAFTPIVAPNFKLSSVHWAQWFSSGTGSPSWVVLVQTPSSRMVS